MDFQALFETYKLEPIIECNKVVDYLHVTFNLNNGTYKPYHKPDDNVTYVNVQSNHPPKHNKTTTKKNRTSTAEHLL